jgi:hypothetical protein
MRKTWHPFQPGQAYSTAEVVSLCDRRIREGEVISVETKKVAVHEIEIVGYATLVWKPTNRAGFGASPFNPRLWRTTDGQSIFPIGHRYHSPTR